MSDTKQLRHQNMMLITTKICCNANGLKVGSLNEIRYWKGYNHEKQRLVSNLWV